MNNNSAAPLDVAIRELPAVRVAYLAYKPGPDQDSLGREIRQRFECVQSWLETLGYDPYTRLTIGAFAALEDRLLRYECCIEVPEEVEVAPEDIRIKRLPGGRYAVITIARNPEAITESVRRFYEEYALQNNLEVDFRRPTYEIYYADVLEYCVPLS